jgi:NUDE protein, C-terminal conserved region
VVKSSLEDIQTKYDKATEEVALLQAEVASADTLRIENQRLKDELRDLKEEYMIVKQKSVQEGSPSPSIQRHHTPPSPPISDVSRALTPGYESQSPPKAGGVTNLGGVGGTGTWRGVRRGGAGKRLSIASDVSWASEARQTSSVKIMHDMVSRVKVTPSPTATCLYIEPGGKVTSLSRLS